VKTDERKEDTSAVPAIAPVQTAPGKNQNNRYASHENHSTDIWHIFSFIWFPFCHGFPCSFFFTILSPIKNIYRKMIQIGSPPSGEAPF